MAKNETSKKTGKSLRGRPPRVTPEIVRKLEEAFAIGCSDVEACLYADISRTTLWVYQESHPEFLDRKETLKERPVLMARTSVVKALKGDPDLALKFLERKKKKEFSLRTEQEVEHTGEVALKGVSDDELKRRLSELVSRTET